MTTWPSHLAQRFGTPQPRKLLALDGGGIRGVLTLEILAEMERQIHSETGIERLCDYFDYIAGTSTGSIIAAGLAVGMSTQELLAFYRESGSQMFEKTGWITRVTSLLSSLYLDEPLALKLKQVFHDGKGKPADLTTDRLRCLLLVVTRNVTTDSPWPISTNPFAMFNDLALDDCNLRMPLWQLVRASTAAPVFFPPEIVRLNPKKPDEVRVFVDGGVTPYNNPAFLLFRMATQPAYRLNWPTGSSNLLLVSVGTGAAPNVTDDTSRNVIGNLGSLPSDLMYAIQVDQDVNCRTFGHCVHGSDIDLEMGNLVLPEETAQAGEQSGRFFRYARYNADLSQAGLAALGLGKLKSEEVQKMDAVDQIESLSSIGKAVALRDVKVRTHFGPFLK